ncbi:hypothetical protein, partial [Bradyrhizobium oropedii]|uniref:hypothetical protein n=1 Tax=Bradyrhizobium oropedii TaxID=1571201 RepID=UPI001E5322E0
CIYSQLTLVATIPLAPAQDSCGDLTYGSPGIVIVSIGGDVALNGEFPPTLCGRQCRRPL